jgi:hypothetical protein
MFGKFTLIGVTTGSIGLPQIPFSIPMLTFFNVLSIDTPGTHRFVGKITHLLTGKPVGQAQGVIQPPQAGPVVMPMQFGNLQFGAFDAYNFSLEFEGHEPFVTEFQVVHVPPPQIQVIPRR